jgi:hypothetical protein
MISIASPKPKHFSERLIPTMAGEQRDRGR